MDRSRKIFLRIASASYRVVTAANEYADRKDTFGVQRSHFQLEEEMRRISVACECIARILSKSFPDHSAVDVRLQDWLGTDEPRMCFDILNQMESLLREDAPTRVPNHWTAQITPTGVDKIEEAVAFFESRKGFFHFLFVIEIWNHESSFEHQQDLSHAGQCVVPRSINLLQQSEPEMRIHLDGQETIRCKNDKATAEGEERRNVDGKKLEEILKWLDGVNCAEKQDIILSFRQPDTCKWLFATNQYKSWRDSQGSFLWLHGKPGAGKSVLASSVIESLENLPHKGEIHSFFYCDFRNEPSTRAAEVMRSVLSQLLRHLHNGAVDPTSLLADLVKSKNRGGATRNSAKQLARFISDTASLWNQKPLVIIDALDECKDIRELLQALDILRGHVRLFVTSRPLQAIRDALSGSPFISMDEMVDEMSADIELHVTRELDARRRLRDLDTEFKTEIRFVLCRKADGMFRWAQCSIDTLDRCVTRKEVRKVLNSLPEGLDETYERTLLAIDTKTREGRLALRALVWLVAALRPLCLAELMAGLSIDLHTRKIDDEFGPMHRGALLDACGSLVTYSEKTDIIILSHFSVKEYLIGAPTLGKLLRYHINWKRAHLQLARTCICYISLYLKRIQQTRSHHTWSSYADSNNISSEHSLPSENGPLPLLDYVFNDGLNHFRHLGSGSTTVLLELGELEVDARHCAHTWDNICLRAKQSRDSFTPSWPNSKHDFMLYILIAVAPNYLLDAFLHCGAFRPKEGTNPLVYAAYFNKEEHARTLLQRGAKLNHRGWEVTISRKALPLEVALDYRHYAMVTLFAQEGSTIPQHIFTHLLSDHYDSAEIPISTARILLQSHEFVEAAGWLLHEPVSQFTLVSCDPLLTDPSIHEQDLLKIVRRLVQVGCDPLKLNSKDESSLQIAVKHGHISILQYLLSLDVPFPSELLLALNLWNVWKRVTILYCLVEHGINVCIRTKAGNSLLHIALALFTEEDALPATELLVKHGCDHLKPNSSGETPLQIAVRRGHVTVVQVLISLGATIPSDTLLTLNSWDFWKKFPMVRCLVENGADLRGCDNGSGDSILHMVLSSLSEDKEALEASRLLISRGCDALKSNLQGATPLHVAFAQGHVSVVQFLLSCDVPFPSDLSMLNLWRERAPMVNFLVENAAEIFMQSNANDSLLRLVLDSLDEESTLKAIKIIVDHNRIAVETDPWSQLALRIATKYGRISVVRYLLSLGTPLPSKVLTTSNSWIFRKKAPMILLLIQNGADALARCDNGDSVLHTALLSSNEQDVLEILKILVAQGCDPFQPDSRGETPLQIAIGRGHISVAQSLLSLGARLPPGTSLFAAMSSWDMLEKSSMIRFLLENGVSVPVRTRGGDSILHIALRSFDEKEALETARLLISHGCVTLEAEDSFGKPPLHTAAERGHVSVVEFLLSLGVPIPPGLLITLGSWDSWKGNQTLRCLVEQGADIRVHTEGGDSILHITLASFVEDDALDATKLLVSRGCDPLEPNGLGKTPLQIAVERGHTSIVQYFHSLGVSVHSQLFLVALGSCDVPKRTPMIRCLLQNGADVLTRTSSGDTLLHIALRSFVEEYALDASKVLINYGCDPSTSNLRGETPIHIAVERGQTSVVKYVRSIGARLPSDILFLVLKSQKCHRKLRMLKFLVEGGADLFAREANGDTVLHVAISILINTEVDDAVICLVRHGCNPAVTNSGGTTPFHIAVARGQIRVIEYLLSQSVPTPSDILLYTIQTSHSSKHVASILRLLIGAGADVLSLTNNGDLLHAAIGRTEPITGSRQDYLGVIKILVSSGCILQARNAAGHTPLHVAILKGYVDVVEFLLSVVDDPQFEDLLPVTRLAPPNVQYQMRSMLTAGLLAKSMIAHSPASEPQSGHSQVASLSADRPK